MKYKKHFKQFITELDAKMLKGYREYSDKSFDLPPEELIRELTEEVLDISGWGLILYVKLKEMENAAKIEIERLLAELNPEKAQ